jgi:hypothetical protein
LEGTGMFGAVIAVGETYYGICYKAGPLKGQCKEAPATTPPQG